MIRYTLGGACVATAALICLQPARAEIVGTTLIDELPDDGRAIFATAAPGRDDELFVVEQSGRVFRLDLTTGQINNTPFLDIRDLVDSSTNEQGLLGLAFHPEFETNGRLFVNYTHDPGPGPVLDRTRIDEFRVAGPLTSTSVNTNTRSSILEFDQLRSNHNAGWIDFSPNDGNLYIATGDSGGANDPNNVAQNLGSRLGKILRVDVDGDDFPTNAIENFRVPDDNPFADDGNSNTLADIWAYGLRNPFRSSFDRDTGDLYIGDVGQDFREEINLQTADSAGGENYGWRLREGEIATPTGGVGGAPPANNTEPAYTYLHGNGALQGNSVVGGYVYRGPDPEVDGQYFFSDTVSSNLWTFDPADPNDTVQNVNGVLAPQGSPRTPTSFGEDANGNLYVLTLGGGVFRIDTDALSAGDFDADGDITLADYDAFLATFGQSASPADGDGNGVVNATGYALLRDSLVTPAASAAAVPEPTGLLALATGLGVMAGRRRRPL